MPRGRKPSTLKQMTDTKVDGAYADLEAIPGDEFGGRLLQEDMIALERERVASDTGVTASQVRGFEAQDIARLTERESESIMTDSTRGTQTTLPSGTNTQVLVDMIKDNYGYFVSRRFN
tara:strand:- start:6857 stop:7213 length:357 start_codon:yes stop_codon:yes gene_type:complete